MFILFFSLILKYVIDSKTKQTLLNKEEFINPLKKDILSLFNITENELKESIRQFPL